MLCLRALPKQEKQTISHSLYAMVFLIILGNKQNNKTVVNGNVSLDLTEEKEKTGSRYKGSLNTPTRFCFWI